MTSRSKRMSILRKRGESLFFFCLYMYMNCSEIFFLFYVTPVCICLLGGIVLYAMCDCKEYFPIKISQPKNWLGEHTSWPFFMPGLIPGFNFILAIWYLLCLAYVACYWSGWLIIHTVGWLGYILAAAGCKTYDFIRKESVRISTKEYLLNIWKKISGFLLVLWELLTAPVKVWRYKV